MPRTPWAVWRWFCAHSTTTPGSADAPAFMDVPEGYWPLKYVEYAVDQGVVNSYDDGYHYPENPVTRDQMAVFIARSMCDPTGDEGLVGYIPPDPGSFPDVPATGYGDSGTDPYWAYRYIEYCVEHGVVNGYDDGCYYPENSVTRDQMAVFIARAFELPLQ